MTISKCYTFKAFMLFGLLSHIIAAAAAFMNWRRSPSFLSLLFLGLHYLNCYGNILVFAVRDDG